MNKTIFSIALVMTMMFLNCHASGQHNDSFRMENIGDTVCLHRIVLDSIYYESALVYNTQNTRVSGLAVDAAIELFGYDSYVRLILVDEDSDTEYLVFDAYYPKNMIDTMFNIRQFAHETTMLFNITTSHLKIEVNNAVCAIENIYYSDKYNMKTPEQFYADKLLKKSIQDSIILESINHRLRQENKIWVAGNTSLLQMTYDQRKAILPKNENNEIPNLQGFEYYLGGVFDLQPYDLDNRERSSYVDDFDWRDRHGQDWTTVAKYQSTCASCWAFAPISAAENVINLYYNRHLDYDLSEQQLLSCSNAGDCQARGGFMPTAINYLLNNGVVSENCFPYVNSKVPCNNICSNPNEHIAFSNALSVNIGTDNIKRAIVNSGSICINIENIWHYMAICGFKLLKIGDIVYSGTGGVLPDTSITVEPNSLYAGQNCWLFKNSWGTTWGDNGFGYVITRSDKLSQAYKLVNPISDTLSCQDIICEDQDGDGYYNWGIGPKPATCPDCPDEPDCDDSDPLVGPFGEDCSCVSFCDLPIDTATIRVTGTEAWTVNKYIHSNIEVLPNAVLTIKSTVQMNKHCKIVVRQGAKLVVDGGVLTSPCKDMWPGIEVWGDSTMSQNTVNGVCAQGRLELRNGAVIENAVCAVELWHPGDTTTTGGIVYAYDSEFHNNAQAVHALYYAKHNPSTGTEENYKSNFQNCSFIIDNNYSAGATFHRHVELEEVKGIAFQGCSFSVSGNQGISPTCCGIDAYNAGFSVLAYCTNNNYNPCPEQYLIRSSFSMFHDGVHCVSDGSSARTFTVQDALFSQNDRGIFSHNTGYATILGNSFSVGSKADCSFGVYADQTAGFCIEENTFTSGIGTSVNYGVGVFNCPADNDIYRNDFAGLDCGNVAVGLNATFSGWPSSGTVSAGLTYSCNQNDGNTIDFCVLKDGNSGSVHTTQGSSTKAAGNTFDGSLFHFYNDGFQINYYYYSGDPSQAPNPFKISGVTRTSTNIMNSCKSHYGTVIKSQGEKSALEDDFLLADADCADLDRLYRDCVKEGGGERCDELLARLSSRWHDRYMAAGDIVRSDLIDTVTDFVETRQWLANIGDISADRMAIASYIQQGDFDNALAMASRLPVLYGLSGEGLQDHSAYMVLLNLYKTLHDTHRTIDQMTDGERLTVEDIAENGFGFSKSMARAILGRLLNDPYLTYSCPSLPTGSKGEDGSMGVTKHSRSGFSVALTPNPASSWVGIDYILPQGCSQATLDLFNTLGVKVLSVVLEGGSGNKVVMLGELSSGVYGYSVRCGSNVLDGKLVVVR